MLIDLCPYTTRFYAGDEDQTADPLIEEIEGAGNTPAYRGLAYIVFEDMPLADFGNRIPQLQFEIIRSISAGNPDALENASAGVALIPGAGEFVYATEIVTADDGDGTTAPENAHNAAGVADIAASLDELQALAPNLGAVSLVVGWFGDDLRCEPCAIKPGVEIATKTTYPETWSVDGVARADAHLVSQIDGRPAYGGTPSDESVVAAIQDLKSARASRALLSVPVHGRGGRQHAPDPYTGASGQPAYPWRGRITCDPAPGVAGSPDKTAAAATQVDAFFGTAAASDFSVSGTTVSWTGGTDWGWRRMVLHYAHLCAAAGGVDAFLIGSELVGLTQVRDSATTYPAVAALKTLAADVRAILGAGTKIGYGADWSEYNNHQTGDAPGAVLFNLDPLWSDANIDFVGIDNYMPLADWRDGTAHLDYDAANGPTVDPRSRLSRGQHPGRRGLRLVLCERRRPRCADPHAHHRRPRQALGVARQGSVELVGERPLRPRRTAPKAPRPPPGCRNPSRSGSPSWAAPRSTRAPTSPTSSTIPNRAKVPALLFERRARRSDPAPLPRSASEFLERRARTIPSRPSMPRRWSTPPTSIVWCWDARPYPFFPARADVWGDAAN